MSDGLYDLLVPREPPSDDRVHGVVVAIVTDNKDPDGGGRIRVRFPWLPDTADAPWARMATPMAGNGRGIWFPPEVGDEVLVAFVQGHMAFPVIVGALWNGKDKPPESNADGKNDLRLIKSRSGHVIRFSDKKGEETIEILDRSARNRVVIDTKTNTITIAADGDVRIAAPKGTLSLSGKSVRIEAGGDVAVSAGNGLSLTGKGEVTVKGRVVNIN